MPGSARRPEKHRCDVHAVAGQCGIRILKPDRHRTGGHQRECFCPLTLKRIGQAHGENQLRQVLRTIVDSKGNAGALQSDVITAVSTMLLSGHVEAGTALFEAMDSIDLLELRRWAQAVRGKATLDETLSTVLLFRLAGPEKVLPKPAADEIARHERNAALKAARERKKKLIKAAGDRQEGAA